MTIELSIPIDHWEYTFTRSVQCRLANDEFSAQITIRGEQVKQFPDVAAIDHVVDNAPQPTTVEELAVDIVQGLREYEWFKSWGTSSVNLRAIAKSHGPIEVTING